MFRILARLLLLFSLPYRLFKRLVGIKEIEQDDAKKLLEKLRGK